MTSCKGIWRPALVIIGRPARGGTGRKARLVDESFPGDLAAGKLKQMFKAEKGARNRQKLQVACHYKSGKADADAAESACTEHENARRRIAGMRKRGSAAIPHDKPTGRPRKPTRGQCARLAIDVRRGPQKCGYKASAWSLALFHRHARERFGAGIACRTFVDNSTRCAWRSGLRGRPAPARRPRGARRA